MYISIVGIYSLATTHGGPMDGVVALICGAWRAGVSAGGRRHEDAMCTTCRGQANSACPLFPPLS